MLTLRHAIFTMLAGIVMLLAFVEAAQAHPHIFIDAKVTVTFDDQGAVAQLHHEWTFDAAFSSWQVQGLDTDGDGVTSSAELQELADENMVGLAEYGFYTYAGVDGRELSFEPVGDQVMTHEDGLTTLAYSIRPTESVPVGQLELAVNDPEYYVAITFADRSTVTLANAPDACGLELVPPTPMSPEIEEQLFSIGPDVVELPPELAAAVRGTQGKIVVSCTGATPATALDAVNTVAQSRPAPFGGPPPEPGLNLPRTGFFGWLQQQQRDFYMAMTGALAAFRTDFNAFWILGGLSFLYGVFHAAGPGHGKVVISSYVLANEMQARRGIALSFITALIQSVVAIAFVLIAAGILGMTSLAMGDAAHWVGVVAYALMAALGLWLVARKVFGWGHHHHEAPDLKAKAHAHLHEGEGHDHHDHQHHHHDEAEHAHHHVVTPDVATRSWKEQLGVVLAVGLRPCSGALVVLVFALSQGVLLAGILATLLMGLGTGITVAVLATLAVFAKDIARRIGGTDTGLARSIVWWVELAGAVLVLLFGLMLLLASL
ncbi:DUF1007 family protein [Devosia nitrariae]|uniref:Nickel/cobalt efflux system n=1 Tax=Devosia nitrariae TaxID=2071872 RepID=A0ABQ5VYA7_9HYPH|nr:DUF1007 family protein [Devosia nitrariae]GLQ52779.1 hypothetical protein GCM10010862_00370 [Devosia nitrariae]